jgi:hypothetical protein
MLGCVTRGSRNLALAMNTDDFVIWFTVGEDHITPYREARHRLSAVNGIDDYVIKATGRSGAIHLQGEVV